MKGGEFVIDIDTAVVAFGASSNPLVQSTTPGLDANKWNYIIDDDKVGRAQGKVYSPEEISWQDIIHKQCNILTIAVLSGCNDRQEIHRNLRSAVIVILLPW